MGWKEVGASRERGLLPRWLVHMDNGGVLRPQPQKPVSTGVQPAVAQVDAMRFGECGFLEPDSEEVPINMAEGWAEGGMVHSPIGHSLLVLLTVAVRSSTDGMSGKGL